MRKLAFIVIALIIGIAAALDLVAGNGDDAREKHFVHQNIAAIHDVDLTEVVQ